MARRFAGDPTWRGWALYSVFTGIAVIGLFIVFTATSALDESGSLPNSPTGLLQRIAIILGWGWIALLALRLRRQMRAPDTAREGVIWDKCSAIWRSRAEMLLVPHAPH
jgi:hypothetical protein